MPLSIYDATRMCQFRWSVSFVHQYAYLSLVKLDSQVIGVRGMAGVVQKHTAIRGRFQFEFPSAMRYKTWESFKRYTGETTGEMLEEKETRCVCDLCWKREIERATAFPTKVCSSNDNRKIVDMLCSHSADSTVCCYCFCCYNCSRWVYLTGNPFYQMTHTSQVDIRLIHSKLNASQRRMKTCLEESGTVHGLID